MDFKKYTIMYMITFCIGMTIWFCAGLFMGTTYDFVGAGAAFGVGYTGAEMLKDYVVRKMNEKKNKPQ